MTDHEPEMLSTPLTASQPPRWSRAWQLLSSRLGAWIVAAALGCAVIALSIALAVAPSSGGSGQAGGAGPGGAGSGGAAAGGGGAAAGGGGAAAGGGSNARSGPAAGGTTGTVGSVTGTTFTVTTSAGQKVTVNEGSATTYENGTSPAGASAVTAGQPVLVLGTVSSTTIAATQVVVRPPAGSASSAAQVVPFQRGAPATSKQAGQVPADYTEGSGTIVSGATAEKATEAALAAYPGGVVDRVVQLSNGEYEVHNIGVNWPHHVFVDQDFQVVGAS
jgi:hypothetical protein